MKSSHFFFFLSPFPLSTELDLFGVILYSVLTFMAAVSMLVFLEECAYIYRKVPANKKSTMIWVNGAAPVRKTERRRRRCPRRVLV